MDIVLPRFITDESNWLQIYIYELFFFFKKFLADTHVLFWGLGGGGGHWYPCFGFLVASPLGFKAGVGSALFNVCTFPEIHLWCYTCRPLGSRHAASPVPTYCCRGEVAWIRTYLWALILIEWLICTFITNPHLWLCLSIAELVLKFSTRVFSVLCYVLNCGSFSMIFVVFSLYFQFISLHSQFFIIFCCTAVFTKSIWNLKEKSLNL